VLVPFTLCSKRVAPFDLGQWSLLYSGNLWSITDRGRSSEGTSRLTVRILVMNDFGLVALIASATGTLFVYGYAVAAVFLQ
jgi:hypothetical protein